MFYPIPKKNNNCLRFEIKSTKFSITGMFVLGLGTSIVIMHEIGIEIFSPIVSTSVHLAVRKYHSNVPVKPPIFF